MRPRRIKDRDIEQKEGSGFEYRGYPKKKRKTKKKKDNPPPDGPNTFKTVPFSISYGHSLTPHTSQKS
jgi:hypothetical protein